MPPLQATSNHESRTPSSSRPTTPTSTHGLQPAPPSPGPTFHTPLKPHTVSLSPPRSSSSYWGLERRQRANPRRARSAGPSRPPALHQQRHQPTDIAGKSTPSSSSSLATTPPPASILTKGSCLFMTKEYQGKQLPLPGSPQLWRTLQVMKFLTAQKVVLSDGGHRVVVPIGIDCISKVLVGGIIRLTFI